MKLDPSRILIGVAICSLLISACAREQSNEEGFFPSPDETGSAEKGGDESINVDYVLLVEFSLSGGDIVKEEATVLFRGPLSVNSDRTASVSGEGELDGKFYCANKDFNADPKFLGPGEFEGDFQFNVQGKVLSSEEYYEATEEIP